MLSVNKQDATGSVTYTIPPQAGDPHTSTVIIYKTTDGTVHIESTLCPCRMASRTWSDTVVDYDASANITVV